jgi:mannose-6-phosphate isomerase-like protein (cupin superfamily)
MNFLPTIEKTKLTLMFLFVLVSLQIPLKAQTGESHPQPCAIQLQDTTTHYQPILTGPPQTTSMESGLVVLGPGKSGTQHSSKGYEEAIIVLSGEGELRIAGGPTIRLKANTVAYCPTKTVHNIHNPGAIPLKYVYVAAKALR